MQIPPPPATAIRRPVTTTESPVPESSPVYRTVKPENVVDREILEQEHEAAALRHSADEPLPVPEPGEAVLSGPSAR